MVNDFSQLGLSNSLCEIVHRIGWLMPTPIQSQAILPIIQGRDLLAIAQTGSGKTGAFALALLQELLEKNIHGEKGRPAVLILAPTRELALQLNDAISELATPLGFKLVTLIGGVSLNRQVDELSHHVDFVIATPGRLLDHLRSGHIHLNRVLFLVLDEADRMLDMGFLPDIRAIIKRCGSESITSTKGNPYRQTLLFSATLSDEIREVAKAFLTNPEKIEIEANRGADSVTQIFYRVPQAQKATFVRDLVVDHALSQVLIFIRERRRADQLFKHLKADGFRVDVMHGERTQAARAKALKAFKEHRIDLLVATDVAARGLDIFSLPAVINVDLPPASEDFIHRIGRTGRAGERGVAYTLVDETQDNRLRALERFLKKSIHPEVPEAYADFFAAHEKRLTESQTKRTQREAKVPLNKEESQPKRRADSNKKRTIVQEGKSTRRADIRQQKASNASVDFDYVLPEF